MSRNARRSNSKRLLSRAKRRSQKTRKGRRKFALEALEPRLLLSADLSPFDYEALRAGVNSLAEFGERLDTSNELASKLPLQDDTLGDMLDIGGILKDAIANPILDTLERNVGATDEDLQAALETALTSGLGPGLDISSISTAIDATSAELDFLVSFEATRDVVLRFDLGDATAGNEIELDGLFDVPVQLSYEFDARFGVDGDQTTAFDAFFIEFAQNSVRVQLADPAMAIPDFTGRVGFLGVSTDGASSALDMSLDLSLDFMARQGAQDLASAPLGDFLEIHDIDDGDPSTDPFRLELPLTVDLDGITLGPGAALVLRDGDLIDGVFEIRDPYLQLENAEELLDFRRISSAAIFSVFGQLESLLGDIVSSDVFQSVIPFTEGMTLADILDVNSAFDSQINANLQDDPESGPNFQTAQELVDLIAGAISFDDDLDDDVTTHDPAILFDIQFSHIFDVLSVDLDLGEIGDLGSIGIDASTTLDLDAEIAFDLQLGVILSSVLGGRSLTRETKLSDFGLTLTAATQSDIAIRTRSMDPSEGAIEIDLSAFLAATPDPTLGELLDKVNADMATGLAGTNNGDMLGGSFTIGISEGQDGLVINDGTFTRLPLGGELTPGQFEMTVPAGSDSTIIAMLGLDDLRDPEREGKEFSTRPINGRLFLQSDTALSALNRGNGPIPADDAGKVRFTLRDGTAFDVTGVANSDTAGELIAKVHTAAEAAGAKTPMSTSDLDDIQFEFRINDARTGFDVIDKTEGETGSLRVAGIDGSLAPVGLGIAGTGEQMRTGDLLDAERTLVIEGDDLFGRTFADNVFLGQKAGEAGEGPRPMVEGTVRLTASDIDASASFGFVEVSLEDGTGIGQLSASFSLGDPGGDGLNNRVTLMEAFQALSEAETKVKAPNVVEFPTSITDTYAGVLEFTLAKTDEAGQDTTFFVPFIVPPVPAAGEGEEPGDAQKNAMKALVAQLNEVIELVAQTVGMDPAAEAPIRVGSDGMRLTFRQTDGLARKLTVEAGTPAEFEGAIGEAQLQAFLANAGMPLFESIVDEASDPSAVTQLGIPQATAKYVAFPKIEGSAFFDLPATVDLDLPGFDLPDFPTISLSLPDLSLPDLTLPDAFVLDLGPLGDLISLRDLDFGSLVDGLRFALDALGQLEFLDGIEFFNVDLPLIHLNFSELLNIGVQFGRILTDLELNPVAGLGALEEALEDILGIAENTSAADLPDFAVFTIPELNAGLSFQGVDLSDRDAFVPTDFRGVAYLTLEEYLLAVQGDDAVSVNVSLDKSGGNSTNSEVAVRIDLAIAVDTGPRSFDIDFDLNSAEIGALSQLPIDIAGSTELDVDLGATLYASIGIDFTYDDPTRPERGLIQSFLYDWVPEGMGPATGTRLEIDARADAQNIDFDAALGGIAIQIVDGMLQLVSRDDPDDPARLILGLQDRPIVGMSSDDQRTYAFELSEDFGGDPGASLTLDDVGFDIDATVISDLPIHFDYPANPLGLPTTVNVDVSVPSLLDVSTFEISTDGALQPIIDFFAGDGNFEDRLFAMVGGWEGVFDLLVDAVRGEVLGFEIPLIGDSLAEQADFLEQIRDSVLANLQANGDSGNNAFDDVGQAIFDGLGPVGIGMGWLQDISSPGPNRVLGANDPLTPDGQITLDDIVIRSVDGPNAGFTFEFLIEQEQTPLTLPVDFDLDIPGLHFNIDAPVTVDFGFRLPVKVGVDIQNGFYLDTSETSLSGMITGSIPGLAASGELGFLNIDVTDLPSTTAELTLGLGGPLNSRVFIQANEEDDDDTTFAGVGIRFVEDPNLTGGTVEIDWDPDPDAEPREIVIRYDPTDRPTADELITTFNNTAGLGTAAGGAFVAKRPMGVLDGSGEIDVEESGLVTQVGLPSSVEAGFDVVFQDQDGDDKLTLSEVQRIESFDDALSIAFVAGADINLEVIANLGGASFPSVRAELGLESLLAFNSALSNEVQAEIKLNFNDVSIDIGGFFNGFAADVLGGIGDVLEPLEPILAALTDPLPVISDLAGSDVSLVDLARLYGGSVGDIAGFVSAVDLLNDVINAIPTDIGSDTWLTFGGFVYDVIEGEIESATIGGLSIDGDTLRAGTMSGDIIGEIQQGLTGAGADSEDSSQFLTDSRTTTGKGNLLFPLLSDPTSVFGLLTGEETALFGFELPEFEFEAVFSKFFPIPGFPILGAEISGRIGARVDLAFGFDSVGIQRYLRTDDIADIFDGFFVFDTENIDGSGEDIPELVITGSLTAAAKLDAAVVSASVGGGIFATVNFNLNDPIEDGKIRAGELLSNFLLGPIHIFDVSGTVDASLFAELVVDLELVSIDETYEIATVRLLEFDIPRPPRQTIELGDLAGGVLDLNVGANAARRVDGLDPFLQSTLDDDVRGIGSPDEAYTLSPGLVAGSVVVDAYGISQEFQGVTSITGNFGTGEDTLTVTDGFLVPIRVSGGDDDDTLMGGMGDDRLEGGDGDDQLEGEDGNDVLLGGGGLDTLLGGEGDDELRGGDDADSLDGGAGNDRLFGDAGRDFLEGGRGDDELHGGDQADHLKGDSGNDELFGDAGGDQLDGGAGADTLMGGLGADVLDGEAGFDVLRGNEGDDRLFGGTGNDTLFGDAGNDQLFGGNSRDTLYGGDGDDLLFGQAAGDDLFGGLGDDILYSSDADQSVNESIHTLVGGGGNDLIYGNVEDDTIFGDGVNDEFSSVDPSTDGDDLIFAGAGNDQVSAGGGSDVVHGGDGDDTILGGDGDDRLFGQLGNDFIAGDLGDDLLRGAAGDDVLFGGVPGFTRADVDRSTPTATAANFELPQFYVDTEAEFPTGFVPAELVSPIVVAGQSIAGVLRDGKDRLFGDEGLDLLFGGSESDVLSGGDDADYLDGGSGDDLQVSGDAGEDVVRGGDGNDVVRGADGLDQVYGDGGDDLLYGDEGNGATQAGQRLYGGAGQDTLHAFAPSDIAATEAALAGDQLFGGNDNDLLLGNLRMEILDGGSGNDILEGDRLAGPLYANNPLADRTGGADLLLGGSGEDQLFGGGGDDELWGGADTDWLEGQFGDDTAYGGSGIDLFLVPIDLAAGSDTVDGHFGERTEGDSLDDNATDVAVILGTENDDVIIINRDEPFGANPVITINANLTLNAIAADGTLLIEQFQISGLGGDDTIGFFDGLLMASFGVSGQPAFASNGSDWVGVFDGGDGDDTIYGSVGRDRLDGGPGSDTLFGFGGDDRLFGDGGDGVASDHDTLFAGQGNDDLIGGQGTNELYAWSIDPRLGGEFGVFVGDDGSLERDSGGGAFLAENTGLNRIVGGIGDDELYGGTVLDFLFGNGGDDTLYRADGSSFDSLDGGLAGDAWKEYAQQTDQVWYVGGTNAADEIRVDFVTEPGVLADHHLITRLTNNDGNFSFSAQVRLDFAALDDEGNPLWDLMDIAVDFAALGAAQDAEARGELLAGDVLMARQALVEGLLPPEGDFLAIIIDALDGNDVITVGPTVQKTVWIDAGAGDDVVEIRRGNTILPDRAELNAPPGLLRGRNDVDTQAFGLDLLGAEGTGITFTGLTIDNPFDVDWFRFDLSQTAGAGSVIEVAGASPIDELTLALYDAADPSTKLATGVAALDLGGRSAGSYLLRVESNQTPTLYDLRFDFGNFGDVASGRIVDLGIRNDAIRRDVILGGAGNDILIGGGGEDFIFGQAGNDLLNGGLDRQASDLLFGGEGDDLFQVMPDALPPLGNQPGTLFDPATATFIPTASDQMIGGEGNDRVVFLGGDLDRLGRGINDFVAVRYNTGLHRYEFASLVWDIGLQGFRTQQAADPSGVDGNTDWTVYEQEFHFFQTRDIEGMVIATQRGDDVVHADHGPGYRFLPLPGSPNVDPSLFGEWGIDPGDFEQGARIGALTILGGDGDDKLYGGALNDVIDGGAGVDYIEGGLGDDTLVGGPGADVIFGHTPQAGDGASIGASGDPGDPTSPGPEGGFTERFDYPSFFLESLPEARTGLLVGDIDADLDDAFALEGPAGGSALRHLIPIGDFDGDGLPDFLVEGEHESYVILRPFEFTSELSDLETLGDHAQFVVDHDALGVPIDRYGDLNNDGLNDLAFVRRDGSDVVVTIIDGRTDVDALPRQWDANFVSNFLNASDEVRFNGAQLSAAADVRDFSIMMGDLFGSIDDLIVVAPDAQGTVRETQFLTNVPANTFATGIFLNGEIFVPSGPFINRYDANGFVETIRLANGSSVSNFAVLDGKIWFVVDSSVGLTMGSGQFWSYDPATGDLAHETFSILDALEVGMRAFNGNTSAYDPTGPPLLVASDGDELYFVQEVEAGDGGSRQNILGQVAPGPHAENDLFFLFDRTIDLPTAVVQGSANATVSFDLEFDSVANGFQTVLYGAPNGFDFRIEVLSLVTSQQLRVYTGGGAGFFNISAFDLTQQHTYTVIYTGDRVDLFVDGIDRGGVQFGADQGSIDISSLTLGRNLATGNDLEDAHLDNLVFWNRGLTDSEAIAHGSGGLNAQAGLRAGITGLYRFDAYQQGGVKGDIIDESGFENHVADALSGVSAPDRSSNAPTSSSTYRALVEIGDVASVAGFKVEGDGVFIEAEFGFVTSTYYINTEAATPRAIDLAPTSSGGTLVGASDFVAIGDSVYFAADLQVGGVSRTGRELFSVFVNPASGAVGTAQLVPGEIGSDEIGSNPTELTVIQNAQGEDTIVFSAIGGNTSGRELWSYTPGAGNVPELLVDVVPGPTSSSPSRLTAFAGMVFFTVDGNLYRYDPISDSADLVDENAAIARLEATPEGLISVSASRIVNLYFAHDRIGWVVEPDDFGDSRSDGSVADSTAEYFLADPSKVTPTFPLDAIFVEGDDMIHFMSWAGPSNAVAGQGQVSVTFDGDFLQFFFPAIFALSDPAGGSGEFVAYTGDNFDLHLLLPSGDRILDIDSGFVVSATTGDFDGDGDRELAIVKAPPLAAADKRFELYVFFDPDTATSLADGVLTTRFLDLGVPDSGLPLGPNVDWNRDGIDDLILTVRGASSDPIGAPNSGILYAIFGAAELIGVPTDFDELSNISVRGSGGFLVDRGTGRPSVFRDGDQPFGISAGGTRWFRFSTLGDGEAGNFIRTVSTDADAVTMDLVGADGRLVVADLASIDLEPLEAGTYYLRVQSDTDQSFEIEAAAARRGATHEGSTFPDRDTIRGGDGDDILIGDYDLDRIYGESGDDQIAGLELELRDVAALESHVTDPSMLRPIDGLSPQPAFQAGPSGGPLAADNTLDSPALLNLDGLIPEGTAFPIDTLRNSIQSENPGSSVEIVAERTTSGETTPPGAGDRYELTASSVQLENGYIDLSPNVVSGRGDVTAALWMRSSDLGSVGGSITGTLFSAANGSNANLYALAFDGPNRMRLFRGTGGTASLIWDLSESLDDDEWHFIVVARDATNDQAELFIDGVSQGIEVGVLNTLPEVSHFLLGQEQDSNGGGFSATQALRSDLDEVSFWDGVLDASEIQALMASRPTGDESRLIASYGFNEVGGTIVHDRSGNGFDGFLSSAGVAAPILPSFIGDSALPADVLPTDDDGRFLITVTVTDSGGNVQTGQRLVEVENVAPTADFTAPGSLGVVGESIVIRAIRDDLAGGPFDPGVDDTLTNEWRITTNNGVMIRSFEGETLEFVPTTTGRYTIELIVVDSDGARSAPATTTVEVGPVASINEVSGPFEEGDVITLDADVSALPAVGGWTREFLWVARVDGREVGRGTDELFQFIPDDEGTYDVVLLVTDRIGGEVFQSDIVATALDVANVAPSLVAPLAANIEEGTFTLEVDVTDRGAADLPGLRLEIDWGDGSAIELLSPIVGLPTHDYLEAGEYDIHVTLFDDLDSVDATTSLRVTNQLPVIAGFNAVPAVLASAQLGGALGGLTSDLITDGGTHAFAGQISDLGADVLTVRVDFGDGTSMPVMLAGDGSFSFQHPYANSGRYEVVLTVDDGEGGVSAAAQIVELTNVAPENLVFDADVLVGNIGELTGFSGTVGDYFGDVPGLRGRIDFGGGNVLPVILEPTGLSGDTQSFLFSAHTIFTSAGTHDVRVTITDADGGTTTQLLSFTVRAPGDFGANGVVDDTDFGVFLPDFVLGIDGGAGTDLNRDGIVDIDDFNRFLELLESAPAPASAVPLESQAQQLAQISPDDVLRGLTDEPADSNLAALRPTDEFAPIATVEIPRVALPASDAAPSVSSSASVARSARVAASASLGAETRVEARAEVGEDASVGDRSTVGGGARIGDRVRIGMDVTIEPGAVIPDDSVVLSGSVVVAADPTALARWDTSERKARLRDFFGSSDGGNPADPTRNRVVQ